MTPFLRRTLFGLTVPALFLALPPVGRGHGCCGGGMNPVMLQYMQMQLMQQYALLQQQTSSTMNFQRSISQLATQSESSLRLSLKDDDVLTRLSAAYVAGEKRLPLQAELIELLTDQSDAVRQAARLSLIKLSLTAGDSKRPAAVAAKKVGGTSKKAAPTTRGIDFGPLPNAGRADQLKAARQWREWWDKRK